MDRWYEDGTMEVAKNRGRNVANIVKQVGAATAIVERLTGGARKIPLLHIVE